MLVFAIVFLTSYLYHGLGITVGYHRILSHRALKVPRLLEYFIVSGGYLCFEGSPISWVTTHRIHHRKTDKVGDPHSPNNGFWHSFVGWLLNPEYKTTKEEAALVCPDLRRDPLYALMDRCNPKKQWLVCLFFCVLFRVVILFVLGPWAMLANILAAVTIFIAAFLVNSVCHLPQFGYRTYDTDDESRNVLFVGLMALGEGWHNNHHAMPQSARHGLTWREPDISWWAISILKALGLARDVRLPVRKANALSLDDPAAESLSGEASPSNA